MMKKRKFLLCLLILCVSFIKSYACTTWATLGDINEHGGLLLTKNRDEEPQKVQQLQLVIPSSGYHYLGLKYKSKPSDASYTFLSAGINEKGVTVVNNASSANAPNKDENETILMENILTHYSSVADIVKDQQKLFTHSQVNYLLIGDKKEVALVEIAPNGQYSLRTMLQGIMWHTNYYVDPDLAKYNDNLTQSSIVRYRRIDYLLHQQIGKFTMADNVKFALDHVAGDNNSILRKWTVASWFIEIPEQGAPKLYLKLFDPYQPKKNILLVLNKQFWQQKFLTAQ